MRLTVPFFRLDPRYFQIAVLASLLAYGWGVLSFDIEGQQILITLAVAQLFQLLFSRTFRVSLEWKSAMISGLSLCLLLRTHEMWLNVAAAFLAVGGKFLIRREDKHVFNPTNIALVLLLLTSRDWVWVSSGQWGSEIFFAFLMACLGGFVVFRSLRTDVSLAFLAFWSALLINRSLQLGEPMTIPWHRLQSGSLLLFTFFMISDPKTTPNSRAGRILFAFLVAYGAYHIQFHMFRYNGLLWSLGGFSLLVPLIDKLLPAERYQWSGADLLHLSPT